MIQEYRDSINLKRLFITQDAKVSDAIKKLNEEGSQILLIVDEVSGELKGTLTDGDIRRMLSKGISLSSSVENNYCTSPKIQNDFSLETAKILMEKFGITRIPIVNSSNKPIGLIGIEDINISDIDITKRNNPVVIMAGGKGTRLYPITKVIPKPLLPIGDKPIVHLIMESFQKNGFNNFLMSVNYKKEYIKTYFANGDNQDYFLSFIEEEEFLGTAGSLRLMKEKLTETFFVTNCDIMIETNYTKALDFHNKCNSDLTVIGALSELKVPYGVLETDGNALSHISEKPQVHFMVNTGVYILEPSVLEFIPNQGPFDMPDLIKKLMFENRNVSVYPTHQNWIDIGTMASYKNILD